MTLVYAIGSNGAGQLGIGHQEDVSVPKPVFFEDPIDGKVALVKAGGNHTLLMSFGKLYTSGDRGSGACGRMLSSGDSTSRFQDFIWGTRDETPQPSIVRFCAATWEASIVVKDDENGHATQVYSFGNGNKGELGQGVFVFCSVTPSLIPGFPPAGEVVVDLAASVSHVVAVLSNGRVYGWGSGRKGQIGQPEEVVCSPRIIPEITFHAFRAVCGREFTYVLGKEAGQQIVLGADKWNIRSSAPPGLTEFVDVGASWGSIFVLQKDGALLSWGRNDHGQLAPPGLPKLSQIAAGSEHALGLTQGGDVLAWGWGEHGNCGPNTKNGDVKGRWNTIASSHHLPPNSEVTSIGAGCATSWICINQQRPSS